MWQAVAQIMEDFEQDDAIRVIVLSGAGGKAFVSGADISEFKEKRASEEAAAAYAKISEARAARLQDTLKPTIAMIRGYCIGGGLATALACDIRIAAEGSRFGIPAAKLGLGYAYDGIKKLIDTGRPGLCPRDLLYRAPVQRRGGAAMGLVNRVVPADELEAYVKNYCDTIAANAPLTVRAAKQIVREALKDEIEARHGAVPARRRRVLRQRGLRRGPHRLHGKAPPGVQGPLSVRPAPHPPTACAAGPSLSPQRGRVGVRGGGEEGCPMKLPAHGRYDYVPITQAAGL